MAVPFSFPPTCDSTAFAVAVPSARLLQNSAKGPNGRTSRTDFFAFVCIFPLNLKSQGSWSNWASSCMSFSEEPSFKSTCKPDCSSPPGPCHAPRTALVGAWTLTRGYRPVCRAKKSLQEGKRNNRLAFFLLREHGEFTAGGSGEGTEDAVSGVRSHQAGLYSS